MGKQRKGKHRQHVSAAQLSSEIRTLNESIQPLGLKVRDVPGDGNCLFRAVSDQLYDNPHRHSAIRQETIKHIVENEDNYAPFVEDDETFEDYTCRIQKDGEWGGNIEIQAMSVLYGTDIVIHACDQPRMEVRNPGSRNVIHLAYLTGEHYGSARYVSDNVEDCKRQWLKGGAGKSSSSSSSTKSKKRTEEHAYHDYDIPDEMFNNVYEVVGDAFDEDTIRDAIRTHEYDVDVAIAALSALSVADQSTGPTSSSKWELEEMEREKEREKHQRNIEKARERGKPKNARQRKEEEKLEKRLAKEKPRKEKGSGVVPQIDNTNAVQI